RRAIERTESILGGGYKWRYISEEMMRVGKGESKLEGGVVNKWDRNGRAGIGCKGMLEMIEGCFRGYGKGGEGKMLNGSEEGICGMG
ncbi:lysozyme family protein, partial [Staphylococcus epidermidis]